MGRWKRRSTLESKMIKLNINDSDQSDNDDNANNNKNDGANKNIRKQPPSLTNTQSDSQASSHSSSLSSKSSLNKRSFSPVSHDDDVGQQQQKKNEQSSEHNDRSDSQPKEFYIPYTSTLFPTTKVTSTELSTEFCDPPTITSIEDYLIDYATRKTEFEEHILTPYDEQPIVISNHSFPALTPTVLSQPYLSLPSTLESHERRVLHELCFSIGLYHATTNTTPPCLIVAIDRKGLCAAQAVVPPPVMPYMKEYRPWYYQKSVKDDVSEDDDATDKQGNLSSCIKSFTPSEVVREEMNAHHTAINALLMNPKRCLRPCDVIDFDEDLKLQKCLVKMVKSPQELENMIDGIAKEKDVGFGVWNYTESKYYEMTNLVLLSTATTCYIIDVTSQGVWGVVRYHLSRLFSNNDIVKVSYGGGGIVGDYQDGIASLCRDFGLGVINHFDIREAALSTMMAVVASSDGIDYGLLLRYYGLSEEDCARYKHLREVYGSRRRGRKGGDGEEKTIYDPRRRPLRDDMISFMAYEVGYLVTLRRLMMRDMTRYDFIGYDGATTSPRNFDSKNNVLMEVMERKSLGVYAPMSSSEDDVDGFWTAPDSDEEEGKQQQQQRVFDAFHLGRHKEFKKVLVSSQKVCLNFWQHKKEIPTHNFTWRSILSIYRASASSKNQQQLLFNQKQKQNIYIKLFQWRQQIASSLELIPGSICSTEFLATMPFNCPASVEDVRLVAVFLPSMLEEEDGYVEQILEICNAVMEEKGSCSDEEGERGYVSDGSSMSGDVVKRDVDFHHDATMNVAMSPMTSNDDGSEFEDCVDGDHNNDNDEEMTTIAPLPMINDNDETKPKIGNKKRTASLPQQHPLPPKNKDKNQISPYTPIFQQPVPTTTFVVNYTNKISNNIVPSTKTKMKLICMPGFLLKAIFKKICCAVCIGHGYNNSNSSSYHYSISKQIETVNSFDEIMNI